MQITTNTLTSLIAVVRCRVRHLELAGHTVLADFSLSVEIKWEQGVEWRGWRVVEAGCGLEVSEGQ